MFCFSLITCIFCFRLITRMLCFNLITRVFCFSLITRMFCFRMIALLEEAVSSLTTFRDNACQMRDQLRNQVDTAVGAAVKRTLQHMEMYSTVCPRLWSAYSMYPSDMWQHSTHNRLTHEGLLSQLSAFFDQFQWYSDVDLQNLAKFE